MIGKGKHIIQKFLNHWQLLLGLEILLYAIGCAILIQLLFSNFTISIIVFLVSTTIASLFIKPWKYNLEATSNYLDSKLKNLEYSTELLLSPWDQLTDLAKLQHLKISDRIAVELKEIKPPQNIVRTMVIAIILILTGVIFQQIDIFGNKSLVPNEDPYKSAIQFQPADSLIIDIPVPKIEMQKVSIRFPEYTNVGLLSSTNMNIKGLEGSIINWYLKFDSEVTNVVIQSMGNEYPMNLNNNSYTHQVKLTNSGFYNFKFEDKNGNAYTSNLYGIEVEKDTKPVIEIKGINQFTSFDFDENQAFEFKANISDDYGVSGTHIIATVSKGSGESVKFREEKLQFENQRTKGAKKLNLTKRIDLGKMNMEPGDELYFYIESADYKSPQPNIARSETFFATIKDTISYLFGVEGTLGVDRMPDYFRSQRQLIIDTEKLIAEKPLLTKKDFNFKSNELGYDQKALRLKYGAFMGEESEIALEDQTDETPAHEIEHDPDDPLAGFTHDHDSENEHNLVADKKEDDTSKNPLQDYEHNHGDPEMATLFEESLKVKLHKALAEMWDAELYLRLYEPHNSLPYQYRALKLIQDIKNSARIYVHRIGFDPPPIKEDIRLSGKLDGVSSYRKTERLEQTDIYPFIKESVVRIESLKTDLSFISSYDLELFEKAGSELSELAIQSPSKYLSTLQQLKWIIDGKELTMDMLIDVQKGLLLAIPKPIKTPYKSELYSEELNQLLLRELGVYDR